MTRRHTHFQELTLQNNPTSEVRTVTMWVLLVEMEYQYGVRQAHQVLNTITYF